MPCQAFELTSQSARRLAARLVKPTGADNATLGLAACYLEVLASTLERIEFEDAGQLSFFETAFQSELFGSELSGAKAATTSSAAA